MIEWFLETDQGDPDLTVTIILNEFREYTIGRKKGYDILSINPLVSRNHGIISVRPDNTVYIKDENSANGIWINDVKITPNYFHLLQNNDLLGIGCPSNAVENKKELFRVRCRPLTGLTTEEEIIGLTDANLNINLNKEDKENLDRKQNILVSETKEKNSTSRSERTNSVNSENNITRNSLTEIPKSNHASRISSSSSSFNTSPEVEHFISKVSEIEKNVLNYNIENNVDIKPDIDQLCLSTNEKNADIDSIIINLQINSNIEQNSIADIKPNIENLESLVNNSNKNISSPLTILASSDEDEIKIKTEILSQTRASTSKNNYESIIIIDDEDSEDIFPKIHSEIKLESCNNFSYNQDEVHNTVVLSDDDEDIFPRSQLFDDVAVKSEPVQAAPEEEIINETTDNELRLSPVFDDGNIFGIIKKEAEEVDNYIPPDDDSDDDADCQIWMQKLSQSQDFLSFSQDNDKTKKITPKKIATNDEHIPEIDGRDLEIDDKILNEKRDSADKSDKSDDEDNQVLSKLITKECTDTTDAKSSRKRSASISSPRLSIEDKSKKKTESKKSYVKPPVIEAPFMIKGKRKAHEESRSKELTIKKKKSKHEDPPSSSLYNHIPIVPQNNLHLDKSLRKELDKRHKKQRRISVESMTRNEKQQIQEERKKKLKQIASKKSEKKKDDIIQKPSTKPKVKVSTSRGIFLTNENFVREQEKRKTKSQREEEPVKKIDYKIPKKKSNNEIIRTKPSTSKTNSEIITKAIEAEPVQATNSTDPSKKKTDSDLSKQKKTTKTVRFIDEPQIRYFEREIPEASFDIERHELQIISSDEETITIILSWVPMWLEEQKNIETSPRLTLHKPIQMLYNFNSPRDYYNIVTPLMLLELWRSVYQDWIISRLNFVRFPVVMACVDSMQPVTENKNLLFHCHCVAFKSDPDNYPGRGDLLIVEILMQQKKSVIKKFGYVTDVMKRKLTRNDIINRNLIPGTLPDFKITFTVMVKIFDEQMGNERLIRIRLVSRIGPPLRIFKSVANLQKSPLCNFILKPEIKDYKISRPSDMSLAITDKLNNDQLMGVYEAYNVCTRDEPGIYMIQGPPGTGKSFVIKNLVRQLLYGDKKNKVQKEKLLILVCAPSNGAVDEIASKLLEMRSTFKQNERFKMIRLGPQNSITNPIVKKVSIPDLVKRELSKKQNNNIENNPHLAEQNQLLQSKINMIKNKLNSQRDKKENTSETESMLAKAKEDLDQLYARGSKALSNYEEMKERQKLETYFIQNAHVICTTLSSCMHYQMEELYKDGKIRFLCCIIDEATQSNEQENLIPLMLGINKIVLVGDSQQLAPTILSQEAKSLGYGNSLFYRIQKCLEHFPENPIRFLSEQYRMHPEICKFPSEHFYSGKLKTSHSIIRSDNLLHPYRLFCLNTTINFRENEYLNKAEANIVMILANIVLKKTKYNIGIITPYSKQKQYLIESYKAIKAKENKDKTEEEEPRVVINTVDGFQGQERDVVIISCVRYKANLFLSDLQRLNVALTRAKQSVFICAHSKLFESDSIWKKLEMDARNRNVLFYLNERDIIQDQYMMSLICK